MLLAATVIISIDMFIRLIFGFIGYGLVKPQMDASQSALEVISGRKSGGGSVDADAVQKALEGIQGYQNELKKATENPLGN